MSKNSQRHAEPPAAPTSPRETEPVSLESILDQAADYLRYLKEEGETMVPVGSRKEAAQQVQPAAPKDVGAAMAEVARQVAACRKCVLHQGRKKTVPGQGNLEPEILFVGEGPGQEEDEQGLAFVGRAGQLLTKMIEAMGLKRDEVFIANVVKCRPPGNRAPMPDEMDACMPYLKAQIALLKPKVIVAMGATAVKGLFKLETGITRLRGKWLSFEGIDVMPTFHPAYLLRNPPAKTESWIDLQEVLRHLGRQPPPRKAAKET